MNYDNWPLRCDECGRVLADADAIESHQLVTGHRHYTAVEPEEVASDVVPQVLAFVRMHPAATLMDVMAEFDLTESETYAALRAAREERQA